MEAADRVLAAVARAPIPPGSRVLVAVSGGPDSVALLDALHRLAPDRDWSLHVGHVNHGLRGEDADDDEQLVLRLARDLGTRVDVVRVDVSSFAALQRLSTETAARDCRRAALDKLRERLGADIVAVGHTLNDQAETVLMRLLRGAGSRGLGAMRSRSGPIVRPLLNVSRSEVLAYLETRGLPYATDASNDDERHTRNWIRRQVIPMLTGRQRRLLDILGRTAVLMQWEADYIRSEADAAEQSMRTQYSERGAEASLPVWRALHPALRSEVLRLMLERLAGALRNFDVHHTADLEAFLLARSDGEMAGLPAGVTARIGGQRFFLGRKQENVGPALHGQLDLPGSADWDGGRLGASFVTVQREDLPRLLAVAGPLHALCDGARVGATLRIRSRRSGDCFRPAGMRGTRKLQDLLVDRKIPSASRDRLPIVESGGDILWVPGFPPADWAAAKEDTSTVLHLFWEPSGRSSVLECGSEFP